MSKNIEIFLFIDALGWEIVETHGFLRELLPERREIAMQFGYSCSAIPTLLSGRQPQEHGHLSLFRFAPEESPFSALAALDKWLKPRSFWERGRVRNWLSKAVKRGYGFTGYFQLYQMPLSKMPLMDYAEKSDLFIPGGMAPWENLADVLASSGLNHHISDWHLGDTRNLEAGRKAIADGCEFLFIYTAELDGLLHDHLRQPEIIRNKLAWYEQEVHKLLKTAHEHGDSVCLTVVSDHGMTPLAYTVDIRSAVEATPLRFGVDYGACYDSTMFRVTFLDPAAREVIFAALAPFADHGHWLSEEEERKYGIYRQDRHFGDAIFLVNPGIQVVPSDMARKPLNGMHGFAPEDSHSKAALLSTAPVPEYVTRLVDVFHLMRERIDAMKAGKAE